MAPMQSVTLRPGVELEATPALNEAGISESQLIRTKNGLTQTMGGFEAWGISVIPSTVRNLHAWRDLRNNDYLSAGATSNLVALTASSYLDITPLFRNSSVAPDFSISSGSQVVTIVDVNSGLTVLDAVELHTPVSIGNLLLQGAYPVNTVVSTGSFTILSSIAASTTITSSGVLPTFTTTQDSNLVVVTQPNHTAAVILGIQQNFAHASSVGGITIQGPYNVRSVQDSSQYTIISPVAASSAGTVTMNSSLVHFHYWTTTGPVGSPSGYGSGGYGLGGYGGSTPTGTPGSPITSSDWTQDNWGETLLSCPEDGPIFKWSPNDGFLTASLVPQAPLANGGIFISMPQQILVCWKSVQGQGNGGFNGAGTQDNLRVRWSDAQEYTVWDVGSSTAAGSFEIPTGSIIRGGMQGPTYGMIWTDLSLWLMQDTSDPTSVFRFTEIGTGCGLIGKHAMGVLDNTVFWCGEQNFYVLSGGGVQALPCTVWDFIFQGMTETEDKRKVECSENSLFSEIGWFFPYGEATENNAYVKYNIADKTWDYGFLSRTSWIDLSVTGHPFAVDTSGQIYEHEAGNTIDGAGNSSFRTGWWAINDGQELAFVDWVLPDFQWGTYGNDNASIQIRFFSVDYPGDTPRTYGPYTVTQANQYISPRLRGRLMSMEVVSASNNIFWRLGRIRFRWGPAGRR